MRTALTAIFVAGMMAGPALAGSDCAFNSAGMHKNMTVASTAQPAEEVSASSHDPKVLTEASQPAVEEAE